MAVIRELAKRFRSYNIFYKQVARAGRLAIYSLKYSVTGAIVGFDVVRVQCTTLERYNGLFRDTSKRIRGNPDDIVETYPSARQWGYAGWSFTTYPAALAQFNIEVAAAEAREEERRGALMRIPEEN
jgi:hypothetical protein